MISILDWVKGNRFLILTYLLIVSISTTVIYKLVFITLYN
ncbi:Uncharacterised protein [Amycolatopsis camponoti]|uniref:Uncharacterized protein n=1 Tax=Amycolatopsis camponoti TaxID=2606593 RepID=A0A6I8MC92_9PSEU|nr:Uncharacterised protein [Amycolatopsis camponoti]